MMNAEVGEEEKKMVSQKYLYVIQTTIFTF